MFFVVVRFHGSKHKGAFNDDDDDDKTGQKALE